MRKSMKATILSGVLAATVCLTGCSEGAADKNSNPVNSSVNAAVSAVSSVTDSAIDAMTPGAAIEDAGFKTVDELMDASKVVMKDIKSLAVSGKLSLNVTVDTKSEQGTEQIKMPVNIDYNVKAVGNEKTFADIHIKADFPEETGEEDIDENIKLYTVDTDTMNELWVQFGGEWSYQSVQKDSVDPGFTYNYGLNIDGLDIEKYKDLDPGLNGKLRKDGDKYIVTQSFDSILASELFTSIFKNIDDMLTEMEALPDETSVDISSDESYDISFSEDSAEMISFLRSAMSDMKEQLKTGKIVAEYDKDGYLLSVTISDVAVSLGIPSDDTMSVTISLALSSVTSFSNYNSITDKEVTVPDDVKAVAVPSGLFPTTDDSIDVADAAYA